MKRRWIIFAAATLVLLFADLYTKDLAVNHLASGRWDHWQLVEARDGETFEEVIARSSGAENRRQLRIAMRESRIDGARAPASRKLEGGQVVELGWKRHVVIPGYFDFQLLRNPGAAFGLMSGEEEWIRLSAFITLTVLSLVFIFTMVAVLREPGLLLILCLSLVTAGALGNGFDRVTAGSVVDFIVWKYTDLHRWPTFNLADVFVTSGALLFVLVGIQEALISRRHETATIDPVAEES